MISAVDVAFSILVLDSTREKICSVFITGWAWIERGGRGFA